MIVHKVEQGSIEWLEVRKAIPTASEFHNIITPAKAEFSKGARKYAYKLIAEIMLGRPVMTISTPWMERGKILESEALKAYEYIQEVQVEKVGFVTDDNHHYGCSPDFLVGEDGSGEIKCLSEPVHMEFLIQNKVDPEHWPQVQGGLWIMQREWTDWFPYCPGLPSRPIRTHRDEKYITKMEGHMKSFREMMGEMILNLQSRGLFDIPMNQEIQQNMLEAG